MASLFKRGRILYLSFYDIMGKHCQRSLRIPATQAGRREAKEIKRQIEANLKRDPWGIAKQIRAATSREKVSELLQRVLDLGYRSTRAISTVKLAELSFHKFIETMGDLPISKLTPITMMTFREAIIRDDGEQNTAIWLRSLGGIFSYAKGLGLLESNPVTTQVRLKPKQRPPIAMRAEEIENFFVKAGELYGARFVRQCRFLYLTGFRVDDSCDFRRADIDFETKIIFYRNKKAKTVTPFPLYSLLDPILESAKKLKPDEYVFAYRSKHTMGHYFKRVIVELSLNKEYSIHTLKSTYTTRLANAGVTPAHLQRLAHHADYRTTDRFYIAKEIEPLREDLEMVARISAKQLQSPSVLDTVN
jgi:integrase